MNDPYENLDENQIVRTTVNISGSASAHLKSLHNRRGTLQATVANLVEKLINALTAHGITQYDPERYEQFINDCVITARPVDNVPTKADSPNDRRGAVKLARNPAK
jgi:hypothetical protein